MPEHPPSGLAEARAVLRRADTRIGHRWWAPAGYLLVLLAAAVRQPR
jgi:hypothetical protein